MESSSPEEDKNIEENIINAIKDGIIRDFKNLFKHEEENYYKPVRIGHFWSSGYIKYESKSD